MTTQNTSMPATASDTEFIFLLCSERSGSNLLTRIFDSHSKVCGPVPTHIGRYMFGNLQRFQLNDDESQNQFIEDLMDIFATKVGKWKTRPTRAELTSSIRSNTLLNTYLSIYQKETEENGNSIAFIKETRVYDWAAMLTPMLDRVRFVYMVRDPRDMSLSWKKAPALRGGVPRASSVWAEDQAGYSLLAAQLEATTGLPVPVIKYEELLANPSATLTYACSTLGLDYELGMIKFHENLCNQSNASMVAEWKNIGRPLMSNNAGKFQNELSIEEIRYIEAVCSDGMKGLGYPPVQPFLSQSEFVSTRETLESQEPWEKPDYLKLPKIEQSRRKEQHAVMQRICNRPWRTRQRSITPIG
jgi:hypothetical protein